MTAPTTAADPATNGPTSGAAVRSVGLTKHYGTLRAVDGIDLEIPAGVITGLLGRNGAGKTTLAQLIAGHLLPTSGSVEVFGRQPYENAAVGTQVCLAREAQHYPDTYRVRHVIDALDLLYPRADLDFAREMIEAFELPTDRKVKSLSRGMRAALAAVIGLASRAPVTVLDEPFIGLDAVARQTFYDHLLTDYALHPRTIVVSTHLINEITDLVEEVVILDHGRLLLTAPMDVLHQDAVTISGPRAEVRVLADQFTELTRRELAGTARSTIRGVAGTSAAEDARRLGLDVRPVTLQELFVALTSASTATTAEEQP